jgi:hypothetical protein
MDYIFSNVLTLETIRICHVFLFLETRASTCGCCPFTGVMIGLLRALLLFPPFLRDTIIMMKIEGLCAAQIHVNRFPGRTLFFTSATAFLRIEEAV